MILQSHRILSVFSYMISPNALSGHGLCTCIRQIDISHAHDILRYHIVPPSLLCYENIMVIENMHPGLNLFKLMSYMYSLAKITTGLLALCQSQSTDNGSCPGDDIIFTCVMSSPVALWIVYPDVGESTACHLDLLGLGQTTDICGPLNRFTGNVTGADSTTLTVKSVDDVVNGTTVECVGGDVDEEICVIGQC